MQDALQQFHILFYMELLSAISVFGIIFSFGSIVPLNNIGLSFLYSFLRKEIQTNLTGYVRKYFFFIFYLSSVIFLFNLFGMSLFSYSATSQIIITLSISLIVNYMTTKLAIIFQKWYFLNILLPEGSPRAIAFLLVFIEIISFFSRILSIAIRLFANITAGHILLKILSTFSLIFLFSFNIYIFLVIVPNIVVLTLTVLETAIACLQAYVFTTLTILYFSTALSAH
jgi:F-type H+-transporting ATPase subunit a